MIFRDSLWKIPTDFTKKVDFAELAYAEQCLKDHKNMIQQLDDSLSALEKAYRAQASTFNSSAPLPTNIHVVTPESALLRFFAESHTVLAARFSNFAVQLSTLRTSRLVHLHESFKSHSRTINAELSRARLLLTDPVEKLASVCKLHEKLIGALVSLCVQGARSPGSSAAMAQALQRTVADFDDRLDRATTQYLQFRSKFTEYCRARDPLFEHIDALVIESSKEIRAIIDDAWAIDSALFEEGKRDQFVDRSPGFNPNLFTDEEPPPPSGTFAVTVDREVEVGPNQTLTGDDVYILIEANGDDWKVRDKHKNIWSVPAECIVPMPK
jgi:hypothetical protein